MQLFGKIAPGLSSPAILIATVWCAVLIGVAVGPIEYPGQPSAPGMALVAIGVSLFILAHQAGAWCFRIWVQRRPNLPAPPLQILNIAVATTSVAGLTGIALIAIDRTILSGVSNGGYAELLRCAPALVDMIEIKRTPLLYIGYLTFSFGFASLVLFLLKGDEIRGWTAILAQLSVLSPVGYAVLYSGRMPILFLVVLATAAVLVRIGQRQRPLPSGHHLLVKMAVVVLLFAIFSSAVWSRRQNFCIQMTGLIGELQEKMKERDVKGIPRSADSILAADLSKMIEEAKALPTTGRGTHSAAIATLLVMMREAWHVSPRGYVVSAIDSGYLSLGTAKNLLSSYFYLTHGIRILDVTWQARAQFTPLWGVYEIGALSPVLRVFFPQNQLLASMSTQLKAADIHGFFPTVWAAAYIDFGAVGAILYIWIWGFAAGWSAFGTRHSGLSMPPLLLTFIIASILLSPVQGPLGIANSAMVLISLVIVGVAIDLASLRAGSRQQDRAMEPGTVL